MKYEKGLYFIKELGTKQVQAYRFKDGQWIELDKDDIYQRSWGEDRPFKVHEKFFDLFTGEFGDWGGSGRSGATENLPGGIRDVDVHTHGALDAVAKKHDIECWLNFNFEPGSCVNVEQNNRWEMYIVTRILRVHAKAIGGAIKAVGKSREGAAGRFPANSV